MLIITSTAAFAEGMPEADSSESRKKIVLLATGGTIAGVGDAGKADGYKPGTLTVDELLSEYRNWLILQNMKRYRSAMSIRTT